MTQVEMEILNLVNSGSVVTYNAFLGALIGGAVSLVGGLLGSNAAKKRDKENRKAAEKLAATPQVTEEKTVSKTVNTNESWVDTERMMADAEAAGFNPVTWLMAGGMGAYTQSKQTQDYEVNGKTVTTGQNAAAAAQLAQPTAPSFGEVLGGALTTGFNLWNDERKQQQANLFQKELVDMQIKGRAQPGAYSGPRSFYAPTRVHQGPLAVKASAYPTGEPTMPDTGDVTVTNPWRVWSVDPTQRDVSALQERYGDSELLDTINGIVRLKDDVLYNVTGATAAQRFDAYKSAWSQLSDKVSSAWGQVKETVTGPDGQTAERVWSSNAGKGSPTFQSQGW